MPDTTTPNDRSRWTARQKWRYFLYGDPGLTKAQEAELETIAEPHDRMVWYMTNVYDRRNIGLLRTERPLRSPRMHAMLSDAKVAPLVWKALEEADERSALEANPYLVPLPAAA